jgi:hypothetical protein
MATQLIEYKRKRNKSLNLPAIKVNKLELKCENLNNNCLICIISFNRSNDKCKKENNSHKQKHQRR